MNVLWIAIVVCSLCVVEAVPICFTSKQCVELTSFVATPQMRSIFFQNCNGGNGFWSNDCHVYANDVSLLFGPVPEVPDLASLLIYTEG